MTAKKQIDFKNVAARNYDGKPMVLMTISVGRSKPKDVLLSASDAARLVMRIAAAHEAAVDMGDT